MPGKLPSVVLHELTREEFAASLSDGTLRVAIIPTASSEQHLQHLAMIHDTASVQLVARLAAEKVHPHAVVTTPLSIGISEHWMMYKGTLSARPDVFLELLHDVCLSLKRHGVPKLLILNGHGGNDAPIRSRLETWQQELDLPLLYFSYWDLIPAATANANLVTGRMPGHAQEFETSIALAAFPQRVRVDRIEDEEARQATAEKGRILLQAAVEGVANLLRKMIEE